MDTIVTPVTVITLDSTRIVHNIKADLVARYFPPVVRLVQYDQSLPIIAVSLMKNGQAYTLPNGAAANIRVHKPDATYVYNPALGCDSTRNIVYFEVTQAMAAANGDGLAIVELVVNGDIAGTSLLNLHFEENPVPEDAIESSDEWETIYELGQRIIASTVTPVSNAADMTDTDRVYLYTGTETGWNQGHMYYYNGTTWIDAGIAVTDKTLTVSDMAADAKTVGDRLTTLDSDVANLKESDTTQNADISSLKEDIQEIAPLFLQWEKGGLYAATGLPYDSDTTVRTKYISVDGVGNIRIYNPDGRKYTIHEYGEDQESDHYRTISDSTVVERSLTLKGTTKYIRVQIVGSGDLAVAESFMIQNISVTNDMFATSFGYGVALTAGSDLNTIKTAGNYIVTSASVAGQISNMPESVGGKLVVMTLYSLGSVHQLYISSSNNWYIRQLVSGSFTDWKKVDFTSNVLNEIKTEAFSIKSDNQTIADNTDINTITTAGNYNITSAAHAATMINLPSPFSGRLVVIHLYSTNSVFQLYMDSNGDWYGRQLISGMFSEWKKFDYTSNVIREIKAEAFTTKSDNQAIADNTDINTITTAGNYNITSAAHAATMVHLPSKYGGRLLVLNLYNVNSVCQLYMDSNSDWYKRQLISGTFSDWKQIATMDDIIDSVRDSNASKTAYNVLRAIIDKTEYDLAFANAFAPISLKGYTGNNQNVHPKVLYFQNGFGGHKYWMAYTPYPNSNDVYENPCIAFSDDGYSWKNIAGNPLDDPHGDGYNSDTHLVYRSDTNTLECWYRYVGASTQSPREETIYRQTSTDGITWTAKEVVYSNTSGDYAKFLSPAVIVNNNKYCMWVVNQMDSAVIDYWEAPISNVTSWTKIRSIPVTATDNGITVKPWHIDTIKDGNQYVILLMCRKNTALTGNACSLFVITSADNETYTSPVKVVEGQDGWDRFMYRSSIVKIDDTYRIYYSAGTGGTTTIYNNSTWGIGITESDTLTSGYIGRYL